MLRVVLLDTNGAFAMGPGLANSGNRKQYAEKSNLGGPQLGQHTQKVVTSIGVAAEQYNKMREWGVA